MHIHLPKPLHGWRELLGEVGVIVVGILIALGAEQIVELIHWRHSTELTTEALRQAAAENLDAVDFRRREERCIRARLTDLKNVFRAHAEGQPVAIVRPVGRPPYWGASRDAWKIALAGQSMSHATFEQQFTFADAFTDYENFDQLLQREQDVWIRLQALDDAGDLNAGDWAELHQSYLEAKALNLRLVGKATYILSNETLGQKPRGDKMPPQIQQLLNVLCTRLQ